VDGLSFAPARRRSRYLERAGTFMQLHRQRDAIADLEKACELGITEGCARLKR